MIISDIIVYDGVTLLTQESPTPPSIATPVTLPVALECVPSTGLVNVLNNVAWYSFTLASTTTLTFDTLGSTGSPDTMVGVYDSTGTLLGYDDDSGPGYLSTLTLTNLAPGTYYIAAGYYYINYGPSDWNAVGDTVLLDDCTLKFNVSAPLQFQIDTTKGSSIDFQLYGENVNVTIDWGDGNSNVVTGTYPYSPYKTYSSPGIYDITVIGQANGCRVTTPGPLTKVVNWGSLTGFDTLEQALKNAANLTNVPNYIPANVNNLYHSFYGCSSLNDSNITIWDTSNVTNMNQTFYGATAFNQNVGGWNTSNVTLMTGTFGSQFNNPTIFNQDIGSWNTTNVTNMANMFYFANNFNQNLNSWNTSNVSNMYNMFGYAKSFNGNIVSWNTGNVANMGSMFNLANNFNQNLGGWNTSNVTNMSYMFATANTFNQDISSWNISNVTDMRYMFTSTPFNQNIGSWNTGNVTLMGGVFNNATSFNQNIGSWNTSKVTDMSSMFESASSFNQDIGNWNTGNLNITGSNNGVLNMFQSAISFNQDLSGWCVTNLPSEPSGFDTNTPAWVKTGRQPIWGTCPP